MNDNIKSTLVYGPVHARRLGKWQGEKLLACAHSLGINLSKIPVCSFDCIYCSCGKTQELTTKPKPSSYISLDEFKTELQKGFEECIENKTRVDCISFVGCTEPTLHPQFEKIADVFFEVKQKYFPSKPIAIFTNATTLDRKQVREALKKFDRTFFKLDAASDDTFKKINRPAKGVKLETIIENLAQFSEETGKVELSAMILRTNYKDIVSEKYINAVKKIKPKNNLLYLCTPDWLRPTNKGKGISLMPEEEILEYVKSSLESSQLNALIVPPKRKGLHPLALHPMAGPHLMART